MAKRLLLNFLSLSVNNYAMKNCKKCNTSFPLKIEIDGKWRNLNNRQFCLNCSPFGQHNTRDITKNHTKKGTYLHVKTFRHNKKLKAIEYLGGKCKICGYNRCKEALHFHHKDPSKKHFGISSKSSWGFEKIKPELDKCILVCGNCHSEIHAGLIDINNYK